MKYTVDHIPRTTPNNRRPGIKMTPLFITIHNTGNPTSTARNERSWLTNISNDRTASYHIVVDEHGAIECLPLNEVGWHAGDGNGNGNLRSIGIEICESGNYAKTLDNAAALVAKLLEDRGWGTDKLRRHWDWSGKICPRLMYNGGTWSGWREFVKLVQSKLEGEDEEMLKELEARIEKLENEKKMPAPAWFVKEFGSGDLGGLINDPHGSDEFWRGLAITLRLARAGKLV